MHKKENKIAILIGYFGIFPWYFDYFLHSCRYNPDLHFYIITDINWSKRQIPDNIFPIKMSLQEIKAIASAKLGFEVALENPYKLCDFRPSFGHLFSELIQKYSFWGYGDIDVIYGQIRNFITDDLMNHYDIISVRHDFLPGAFSLFRNNNSINQLFRESKDFIKVFTNPQHLCFDETNFKYDEFADDIPVEEIESEIESMTHVIKRLANRGVIKAYFDFHVIEGTPGKIKWEKGKLTYKNSIEAVLYHLILLKAVYTPKGPNKNIPDIFYISPRKIYFNNK